MASSAIISSDLAIRLAGTVAEVAGDQATDDAWESTWTMPGRTHEARWAADGPISREAGAEEWNRQADLLRCLFGNPFRLVTLDDAWLTTEVLSLAHDGKVRLAEMKSEANPADPDPITRARSFSLLEPPIGLPEGRLIIF